MLWNKIAYLVSETTAQNSLGDDITTPTERKVYVNKKSIRQSEFYDAKRSDFKPEIMLEVHTVDYQGEKVCKFNDINYSIIRTYDRPDEVTELTLERIP